MSIVAYILIALIVGFSLGILVTFFITGTYIRYELETLRKDKINLEEKNKRLLDEVEELKRGILEKEKSIRELKEKLEGVSEMYEERIKELETTNKLLEAKIAEMDRQKVERQAKKIRHLLE